MNLNQIIIQQKRDDKRYRKYAERQFYRALREQVMPVMENPNATVQVQPMFDAYNRVYQYTGIDSAKKEYQRIKKQEGQKDAIIDLLLNTWSEWMRGYVIQNLGQMIQRVSNNTQDAINLALQDSLELGETRRQTVKRIYDYTLGEIGRTRARMIARTETTRATNVGKRKSADDWSLFNQGVQMYKKWIHVPTPEFREFHLDLANAKPIPQDQAWQVRNPKGGENSMMMPGDASAPGNQTINCNCTTIYMSERFAQRNFGIDVVGGNNRNLPNPIIQPQQPLNIDEAKIKALRIFNQNTKIRINDIEIDAKININELNEKINQFEKLSQEYNIGDGFNTKENVKLMFKTERYLYGFIETFDDGKKLTRVNFGSKVGNGRVNFNPESVNLREFSKIDNDKLNISTTTHEFGHLITITDHMSANNIQKSFWKDLLNIREKYKIETRQYRSQIPYNKNQLNEIYLGRYAETNPNEFLAEAFTEYKLSSNPSKYALQIGNLIDKYFKKK